MKYLILCGMTVLIGCSQRNKQADALQIMNRRIECLKLVKALYLEQGYSDQVLRDIEFCQSLGATQWR